jgi:RNA polymerase sigma-70 factor (ECF subfamily)
VLRLLGGIEHDADDVVQDTWLKAVSALPRFRWESSFRTWLVGIGLNQARDTLRKRARSGRSALAPQPGVSPPRSEDRLDLERAIARLPDGYRTVLILHDVEGYTHPEIGERLEIAVGTSRSQLFHARRALRDLLEPPAELQETS